MTVQRFEHGKGERHLAQHWPVVDEVRVELEEALGEIARFQTEDDEDVGGEEEEGFFDRH